MFIVTNSTYPLTKANEMAAKFQKAVATPLPPYLKRMYTLTRAGDAGVIVLGIYEVQDDKVADGLKELVRRLSQLNDVEGLKYTVETMLTAQEAIPLLGR